MKPSVNFMDLARAARSLPGRPWTTAAVVSGNSGGRAGQLVVYTASMLVLPHTPQLELV